MNRDNIRKAKQQRDESVNEQIKSQARDLFIKFVSQRMRTSFIFPLAEFERVFGYLWGHDIEDESQLTENQLLFDRMYQEVRKSVLDNGNLQLRNFLDESKKYSVEWIGNRIYFKPTGI